MKINGWMLQKDKKEDDWTTRFGNKIGHSLIGQAKWKVSLSGEERDSMDYPNKMDLKKKMWL